MWLRHFFGQIGSKKQTKKTFFYCKVAFWSKSSLIICNIYHVCLLKTTLATIACFLAVRLCPSLSNIIKVSVFFFLWSRKWPCRKSFRSGTSVIHSFLKMKRWLLIYLLNPSAEPCYTAYQTNITQSDWNISKATVTMKVSYAVTVIEYFSIKSYSL